MCLFHLNWRRWLAFNSTQPLPSADLFPQLPVRQHPFVPRLKYSKDFCPSGRRVKKSMLLLKDAGL
jgi:hypothetical protein